MCLPCSAFLRWFVFSVVWHSSQSTLARDVMSVTVLCCATRVRYLLYCNFIGPILTLLTSNFIGPIHTSSISNFIGPWVQYHITSPIINSIGRCRIWATTCTWVWHVPCYFYVPRSMLSVQKASIVNASWLNFNREEEGNMSLTMYMIHWTFRPYMNN